MASGMMVLSSHLSLTSSKSFPLSSSSSSSSRQSSLLGHGKAHVGISANGGGSGSPCLLERRRCPVPMARVVPKARKMGGSNEAAGRSVEDEEGGKNNALLQAILWGMEATYVLWLFLLPYAPGDPVWAISTATVNDLISLSLNFLFILPILNSVGVHVMEAPVLHPVAEGLFNFVIGWTLLFAPLLFSDCKRGRFKGSLEFLWAWQMFLTNTFLIPYMAIRLHKSDADDTARSQSTLASIMTQGASIVAIVGGVACLLSVLWFVIGRADGGYGGVSDRWEYLRSYIGSERAAYAFIWDIVLYSIFQPWLIGDNIQNLKENSVGVVRTLKFVPVVGLVAYLLNLDESKEL